MTMSSDWADERACKIVDEWAIGDSGCETLQDVIATALREAARVPEGCVMATKVLAAIADAYDDNALDDEARKFWGTNDEHENKRDPQEVELYSGRGGRRLLTLADCLDARAALAATTAAARGVGQ